MKQRIEKVQQKLREEKLDALLVTNPHNIRYLTGFVGAESRDAYVVVTNKNIYILTNKLYPEWLNPPSPRLRKGTWLQGLEINHENKLSDRIKEICSKEGIKTLGFEENNLTVAELKNLKKKLDSGRASRARMTLVPTKNLIEDLRFIKDEEEIAALRKAAKLTDETFSFILGYLRNLSNLGDLSESQLAWEIEKYIREHGGQLAFSPIVAFGQNSANPHHTPTKTVFDIQRQSFIGILLDFGARVDGYCADMTRMVFVGKPTEKQRKLYQTVLDAQEKALEYLLYPKKTVFSGRKVDEIARSVFTRANLPPYPHSLGHGVGLQIHEGFRLTHKKDFILRPGMVFTIEPGYYKPNWGGIRIEDLVLLTDNGIEILTKSSKEMIIL